MTSIRNIYFRGGLQSCNYQCSYCSFKRKVTATDKKKDEQSLCLFYEQIALFSHPLQIMLIPYGEGLIHRYYREAMIRLALLPHVNGISCQTNLSFSPSLFIEEMKKHNAERSKIKLWVSFHPEMVEVDTFTDKVHYLYESGIELCAGVVGNKKNKDIISLLRQKMDNRIYLFINAMQGKSDSLENDDIACFTSIDPFFLSDYKNARANIQICSGGRDTVFVDHSGKIYPCPRNPLPIGSMADPASLAEPSCRKKRCDCYIAYSNLRNTSLIQMQGEGRFFRIPEKQKIEAVFFDIDGTLTDKNGKVPDRYHTVLKLLADRIPLYLATSLPFVSARRRLGNLFTLFAGGVFADGGHLHYNGQDKYVPLVPIPDICDEGDYVKEYQAGGVIYKYVIKVPTAEKTKKIRSQLCDGKYSIQEKASFLTIVDAKAGKGNGLLSICSEMNIYTGRVVAVGNTMHDWPMLSIVGYPCAVIDAEPALHQLVRYILNPDHLLLLFDYT